MRSYLVAALFFGVSVAISFMSYRPEHPIIIGLATLLGYAIGRINLLQKDINSLRDAMSADWEARQRQESTYTVDKQSLGDKANEAEEIEPSYQEVAIAREHQVLVDDIDYQNGVAPTGSPSDTSVPEPVDVVDNKATSVFVPPKESTPSFIDRGIDLVKKYFTGGNLFVRIGIIILFFGVSFLLKYASDHGVLPIEYRLIGVVIGAIALLLFGWRLREKKAVYALLLQGAGIGMLYLDIFAAFSLYHLIPSLPAFALMFVISMFAAALAVLQDARSLAVLGFTGGFLAPILVSTGSNNYIGLFSYYLLLNVAIAVIAWFKAWRGLNLLGFFFTFVVATAWGVMKYQPENFNTVEPFLIAFFLLYILITVLFAMRQPINLRGYVDGSLLFGVPLAASGLQYSLVKEFEYGVSLSTFAMGSVYLLLAVGLWKKAGDQLKLLSEAMLIMGVIFLSLAIPFALAPTHTAAAWALEGMGLLWLGTRQNRIFIRYFGVLLQLAAGVFAVQIGLPEKAFINSPFISSLMMAIAGIVSARLLSLDFKGAKSFEKIVGVVALLWGLLWLFGGFIYQLQAFYPWRWLEAGILLFSTVVALVFMLLALRLKPQWKEAKYVALGLVGVMLLTGLPQLSSLFVDEIKLHPFHDGGWIAWPAAFAMTYLLLKQADIKAWYGDYKAALHAVTALLLVAILTAEGAYQLSSYVSEQTGWSKLWLVAPATLGLWGVMKINIWPVVKHRYAYLLLTGTVLAIYALLWGLAAVVARGDSAPLPWIPVLNPLDVTIIMVLVTVYRWWQMTSQADLIGDSMTRFKPNKNLFVVGIAGLILVVKLYLIPYRLTLVWGVL